MEQQDETVLSPVCDLNALTPDQRIRQRQLLDQLALARREVRELSNGYAWRFSSDSALYLTAAEFLTLEHQCCPFFTHTLELEPGRDAPFWLHITGSEAAKEFLRAEILAN